jgi:hypothetical protein
MSFVRLKRDRNSSVALLFAIMAIGVIGMVGAAIDYGLWNQTVASLSLAANGAALNAVKVAAAGQLGGDTNYLTEGATAGTVWFEGQINSNAAHFTNLVPSVSVSGTTTVTATVGYSGEIGSIFGRSFGMTQYPLSVSATAVIQDAPYLDVEILLDNSPSMQIGATPNDIATMQAISTCTADGGEVASSTPPKPPNYVTNGSGQNYGAYSCSSYDGQDESPELACPVSGGVNWTGVPGHTSLTPNVNPDPICSTIAGVTNYAGPPCAFACHFDTNPAHPAGTGTDFFAAARATIQPGLPACYSTSTPGNCQITLRFDLVKSAVNDVITSMQQDNLSNINNLHVGIFSFADAVTQVYPKASTCGTPGTEACQAGDDWSTAQGLVGSYPSGPNLAETGIQPALTPTSANTGYTNFPNVMTTLYQNYLTTSAGLGTSPSTPAKVLFIVTDGVGDYNTTTRVYPPFDPSLCDYYKNTLGYQVYVVYTPYYALMNGFYLSNIMSNVEPLNSSTVATNLQACTSNPSEGFIIADPNDPQSITKALQNFLDIALNEAARYTH